MTNIIKSKNIKTVFKRDIINILEVFIKNNFKIYAVGGCVRDLLMNNMPHDIDFCTDATPKEMKEMFKTNNIEFFNLGEKFGTIVAITKKGVQLEITTFRNEENYVDNRHCDVSFVKDINLDLGRRDFTINAIAYDYFNNVIIDPYNGLDDISKGLITCVGDPEKRLSEDYLRVLRGFRFSVKYNFEIENNTYLTMLNLLRENKLDSLSKERIQDELIKILSITNLTRENMDWLKPFLFYIIPELKSMWKYDQHSKYHIYDLWVHTCKSLILINEVYSEMNPTLDISLLRLATLLHDIGKPLTQSVDELDTNIWHYYGHAQKSSEMTIDIMKKLKFSNKDIENVSKVIRYHDVDFNGKSKKSIKKLINKVGEDLIEDLFILKLVDAKTHNMEIATTHYLNIINAINIYNEMKEKKEVIVYNSKTLAINGNDIIKKFELNGPSKTVGEIMNFALESVLEEKVENKREILLSYLFDNFKMSM